MMDLDGSRERGKKTRRHKTTNNTRKQYTVHTMATRKALDALQNTKDALAGIKRRLQPVLERLGDGSIGEHKAQAQASVALSVGMLRYMGARVRGLDQGRKPDDPLRKELNNIRKVLAAVQKKNKEKKPDNKCASQESTETKSDSKKDQEKKPSSGKGVREPSSLEEGRNESQDEPAKTAAEAGQGKPLLSTISVDKTAVTTPNRSQKSPKKKRESESQNFEKSLKKRKSS
jgi:hypothetical protein